MELSQYGDPARRVGEQWHLPDVAADQSDKQRTFRLVQEMNELGNTDWGRCQELLRELLPADSAVPGVHTPINIEYASNVRVGEHSFFNFGTTLLAQAPITFGEHTKVGPGCSFITVGHPVHDHRMRAGGWEQAHPITVGDNCWFGANVTVLPGVVIGNNCVVGAGAVVARDVPDNSLVLGVPGRVVRTLDPSDTRERAELDGPVDGYFA